MVVKRRGRRLNSTKIESAIDIFLKEKIPFDRKQAKTAYLYAVAQERQGGILERLEENEE